MYTVQLCNSAGPLDTRTGLNCAEAVAAAIEMIQEAGGLRHGDRIIVTGNGEDDE